MEKIIEKMNFNYYDSNNSNLAHTLLELYSVSVSNGTIPYMHEIFKREALPSVCFNNPKKYKDMDNFVNFCNSMDKVITLNSNEEKNEYEENHSKKM